MRQRVIDYIKSSKLGTYKLSEQIPREEGGVSIILKNPKSIYVDQEQRAINQVFQTFDGPSIHIDQLTLVISFANDTKKIPANYSELVGLLVLAKDLYADGGFTNRDVSVDTEIVDDLQVTSVVLSFTKIT